MDTVDVSHTLAPLRALIHACGGDMAIGYRAEREVVELIPAGHSAADMTVRQLLDIMREVRG